MEERFIYLEQLIKTIIHKLNNYLFVISGKLEILLEEKGLSNKIREELNNIVSQIDNMKKLIKETSGDLLKKNKV